MCNALLLWVDLTMSIKRYFLFYFFWLRESFLIIFNYVMSINKINKVIGIDLLGRKIGLLEVLSGNKTYGIKNIINPISLVRYFEYGYCLRHIIEVNPKIILDLSSPRLFSLFIAQKMPNVQILMINPHADDLAITEKAIDFLKLKNIKLLNVAIHDLINLGYLQKFDCVYSISVLEHIAGDYNDIDTMQIISQLLKPHGSVIFTLPLSENKVHQKEFLDANPYPGTHDLVNSEGKFFFQRLYTINSIEDRLLHSGIWCRYDLDLWGEKVKGAFQTYHDSKYYNMGRDLKQYATRDHCTAFGGTVCFNYL